MGDQTGGGGRGMCGGSSCMTRGGSYSRTSYRDHYAWVIRPVEVEEVCVGGSSCMTRGGSYSGTSLGQTPHHCCIFALGRCWYFGEFHYISGRHGNAY